MGLFSNKPKPHMTYEVEVKHKKLRMVLIIVLLAFAAVAITSGIIALVTTEPGWQEVDVTAQERNCGSDFILQYRFSANATAENQKLTEVYNAASVKAYWLFTADEGSEAYKNVYYINRHPGEVITVDPLLYDAFSKLQAAGNRYLYLGPANGLYNSLFYNPDDAQVFDLDPAVNGENKAFVAQIAAFAADPQQIDLQLLGNNQVKLVLGEEYAAFAEYEEIDRFLDFSYMANAFIIDYFAQEFTAQGLNHGYLVSVDGYTRNLWQGGDSFSMNLFDLQDTTIYPVGTMNYTGPMSIVALRDFPIAGSDAYYREGANKTILHPYLSLENGMPQASTHALVATSKTLGCADVLLKLQPLYVAEALDTGALTALQKEGMDCIWFENNTVFYTDDAITFTNLFTDGEITYKIQG